MAAYAASGDSRPDTAPFVEVARQPLPLAPWAVGDSARRAAAWPTSDESVAFARAGRPPTSTLRAGASLGEADFLDRALDVIVRGCRMAAWAYVHAFCVPPGDAAYKALFEHGQGMLEANLETLH